MRLPRCIGVLAVLTGMLVIPASAQTALVPGSGWVGFDWNGTGPIDTPSAGFFLSAVSPVRLRVTDAYSSGDAFDIFINSVLRLSTPHVGNAGYQIYADDAFGSPDFSHGELFLGAGDYKIDISARELAPGFDGGAGFLRADYAQQSVAPEPFSVLLLGTGLAGVAAARRRVSTHS